MADLTMSELASELGLNPSTVSRALDPGKSHLVADETRLRVLHAAAKAGYTPDPTAAGLRRRRSMTVGILVPDLDNETIVSVVRFISDVLDRSGYMGFIAESMDDPIRAKNVLAKFGSRRVDAAISLGATEGDRGPLEALSRTTPVVLAVRTLSNTQIPTVTCDDLGGGSFVGHHLADLGHNKVVQLRGPEIANTFVLRARGFESAAAQRGLELVGEDLVAEHATLGEGRRLMNRVLQIPKDRRPTAIFAHNDELAIGAFEAIREHGLRVPDDFSLVGYNDTTLGRDIAVSLTTIRYPAGEVGRTAGDLALQLLRGSPRYVQQTLFTPELVIRSSTAPPRADSTGGRATKTSRSASVPR